MIARRELPDVPLRDLLTLAYLDGLARKPPLRPVTGPQQRVRIDDTGRPPHVPLRGVHGG